MQHYSGSGENKNTFLGSSRSESNMQPPRRQFFYQKLATVITFFAVGNSSWWGFGKPHLFFALHNKILIMFVAPCLLLQIIYMYINFSELSFRVLGTMFSIVPATIMVIVKVIASQFSSYQKIMKELFDTIHMYKFLEGDDFIKMKIFQAERFSRWITTFLMVFAIFDGQLWIFVPIINNAINKDLIENQTVRMETCLYMWMPFDYGYDYKMWIITHSMNVYLVTIGGMVLALYDSINFIFIFQFLGHIDILKYKIETYFAAELSDMETKERIVGVIEYHSFILRTFKQLEAAFGMNVAVNYAHNFIVDSLLLYQIMVGDKSNRLTYVIMMQFHMGGLILMSFALEKIRMKSDDLAITLYSIPWENMSTCNQKILIPILVKMQAPLRFKAAGGIRAGVKPLASVNINIASVNFHTASVYMNTTSVNSSSPSQASVNVNVVSLLKSTFSYYVMLKSSIE